MADKFRIGVLVFFLLLPVIFMWKVFVNGFVAFPGDLLVGVYYPWQKNIPVKNPLISDAFSQIYSWKYLITRSYLKGHIPLWNQYTFSGYPMLANFHSGSLYPLNALLLGNFIKGWNLILYSQLVLAGIGMYFFLRLLKYPSLPSLIAATGFSFSGFALTMWQVSYAGHAMAWLTFALICIERRKIWMWPIFFFLAVTAGHFQAAVYFVAISSLYYLFRHRVLSLIKWGWVVVVGVLLASAQLLPTFEMAKYAVRIDEGHIQTQNFGLVPFPHLAGLIAPDFFGNPATYNYWGSANYQETVFYIGILGSISVIVALWQVKYLTPIEKFFLTLVLVSLLMGFSTPVGKLIYWLKVPALSTSSASRILMLVALGSAVLAARLMTQFKNLTLSTIVKVLISCAAVLMVGLLSSWSAHAHQIARNLILPTILIGSVFIAWLLRNKKWVGAMLLIIVVFDLFRFGWKYNPFVEKKLVFPQSDEIDFLKSDRGYFRIDREYGPVLPPNTWEMYDLKSASGYDPVGLKTYAQQYHRNLNGIPGSTATRYTELSRYSSAAMGKYGIKYLLVRSSYLKYLDPIGWKNVFRTSSMAVMENMANKGLVYFENPANDSKVDIQKWEGGQIVINTHSPSNQNLIVTTNYYPGWKATINGNPALISQAESNFQKIAIPAGDNQLSLQYLPQSFVVGLALSVLGAIFTLLGLFRPKLVKLGHSARSSNG